VTAYLRFRLPQEQQEYDDAVTGREWRSVVQEMDEELRRVIKYGEEKTTPEERELYGRIRQRLWEMREERGLTKPDE
jgi:hypothetical protein